MKNALSFIPPFVRRHSDTTLVTLGVAFLGEQFGIQFVTLCAISLAVGYVLRPHLDAATKTDTEPDEQMHE